ncbi:MAG: biopolymer transporter ExbD [Pseudomonadota bacterium]
MTLTATTPPRLASRPRRRLRISLTPLIDVVFILLVFFMLASSFLDWRSITLSSAGRPSGVATGVEGAILVDLTETGPRLSGVPMDLAALGVEVASRLSARPAQRILVRPGRNVDMQRMVVLLDTLAAAGARDIALMPGRS